MFCCGEHPNIVCCTSASAISETCCAINGVGRCCNGDSCCDGDPCCDGGVCCDGTCCRGGRICCNGVCSLCCDGTPCHDGSPCCHGWCAPGGCDSGSVRFGATGIYLLGLLLWCM